MLINKSYIMFIQYICRECVCVCVFSLKWREEKNHGLEILRDLVCGEWLRKEERSDKRKIAGII